MLQDEVISEIRERVDMVTLVSEYVRLVKRGSNHVGLCPFHAEKTPSFNVSAAHKFFHCFGCKESGDAFSFVMRMEGVSFPQAARSLAERAGVAIPEQDHEENAAERRERERLDRMYGLLEETCSFFEKQLREHPSAHVARAELERRCVSAETAAHFRLGYAPHAWDALVDHLTHKRCDMNEAEAVGVVGRRRSGNGHYDRFRGRLMFPVRDLGGRVVAFSGRTLPLPHDSHADASAAVGLSDAKYLNSPEGPLYNKGSVLYGLHEARVELRRNGWAILCEGNFDLLALHQAGLSNAVAPLGTAFTVAQAKLIARFGQRVTLLFDGDAAGAKAARAAYPLLAQHALRGLVAQLPVGEDPDSYVRKHGADALRQLLAQAQGIVEYLIDDAARQRGVSGMERSEVVAAIAPILHAVTNPVEMKMYVDRLTARLELTDTAAVERQIRSSIRLDGPSARSERPSKATSSGNTADNSVLAAAPGYVRLPGLQTELLGVLLDRPALFGTPYAGQLEGLLTSPELREVFHAAAAAVQESGALDGSALVSALDGSAALPWLKGRLSVQTYRDRDDAEEVLEKGIRSLAKQDLDHRSRGLAEEINEARRNGDSTRALELTKQRDELRRTASGLLRRER